MPRLRYVAVVPVLSALLAAAGCGGGSTAGNSSSASSSISNSGSSSAAATTTPSGTTPTDRAAAVAQIKAAYRKFFSANAHTAGKYLQDGKTLGKSFGTLQKLAAGAKITAAVRSVTFPSPTLATVHYSLAIGGHVVLGDPTTGLATGQAVKVGNRWVVAKPTFCGLA